MRLTVEAALQHKWLSGEYEAARRNSTLNVQDKLRETASRYIYEAVSNTLSTVAEIFSGLKESLRDLTELLGDLTELLSDHT